MTGALFAFLAASFRSVKWLISASRSTTHRCVFSLESYLPTLGILPHVPLMIAEVYYNMITLPYKGSLLEYKPCSDGQGLCGLCLLVSLRVLHCMLISS